MHADRQRRTRARIEIERWRENRRKRDSVKHETDKVIRTAQSERMRGYTVKI